ncbi:PREDICTED: translocation protein SEC62-like [Priapulus caudatus]|uniref:Translocation protein SEC62 n=1 Tax=Priapulus caudatus TaxID=37621 RepID=A0ABM1EHP2_PRICU|nr:PREDICTED: translocation protein SEC62-like [Priapulus caudatus]
MAERKKTRKRKDEPTSEEPSKVEYAVAKHLRFNLACKKSTMYSNKVDYFTASKAVDMLLDSKWATGKGKEELLFTTRQSCVDYLDRLLQKQLFHRAHKVVKRKPGERDVKRKKKDAKEEGKKDKATKEDEDDTKETIEKERPKEEKESEAEKKDGEGTPKKKEKKKVKLEMHDQQVFLDGKDVYVWIYDPVPPKTFIMGLLIVLGAIAVCLFPLWPPEVRLGVYYLSILAASFVGSIIALAIFRVALFGFVWLVTLGRHYFWLFPNLLEDVGFFDSFKPFYHYEYRPPGADKREAVIAGEEKSEEVAAPVAAGDDDDDEAERDGGGSGSERASGSDRQSDEDRQHSGEEDGGGRDQENGFEVIDKDDFDQSQTASESEP